MSRYIQMRTYKQLNYKEEHNRLHKEIEYVPQRNFLRNTTWTTDNKLGEKTLSTRNGYEPVRCIITGVVSSKNFMLSSVGDCKLNGCLPSPSGSLSEARIRFTLVKPTDEIHESFVDDFVSAVGVIHTSVDTLQDKEKRTYPCITLTSEGEWNVNFEFKIFEKKYYGSDDVDPVPLDAYIVPEEYQSSLDDLKPSFVARRLAIWDTSKELIDDSKPADYLIGNLVKVMFELKFEPEKGLRAEAISVIVMN